MSRLLLFLLVLQLAVVLSQRRRQGFTKSYRRRFERRGRTWRNSTRRQGRDKGLGAQDQYGAPSYSQYEAPAASSSLYGAPVSSASDYGAPAISSYGASDLTGAASNEIGTASGFPSYADRCGDCEGEAEDPVCGSDGKTYANNCQLENYACRKYWDIQEVSKGPCESTCKGLDLGMFSGFGYVRASNQGYCKHDFFRCCQAAREEGLDPKELKTCCNERYSQCSSFVAAKPWKAGVEKFGR